VTGPGWHDAARATLTTAEALVRHRVDWLVTDLDLLDALTRDPQVDHLLARAGVDTAALRQRVVEHADRQPTLAATTAAGANLTYSHGANAVLAAARQLGRAAGSAAEAADILEALAAADEGVARLLLIEAGASASVIRAARPAPLIPAQHQPVPSTTPAPAPPQPRLNRVSRGAAVRGGAVGIAAGLAVVLRRNAERTGGLITVAVFFPGMVALVGLRVYVARLVGLPYRVRFRRWPGEVELYPEDDEGPTAGWRRIAVRLVPHTLVLVLGTIIMTPYLVQFALLSTVPIPVLAHDPQTITSGSLISTVFINAVSIYGPGDMLRLWTGISMWFWAAPAYELVRASRDDLAQSDLAGPRLIRRLVRGLLLAPQLFLRALKPVDEAAILLGSNVIVATAGVSLVLIFIAELTALRWFWS
jgi:hypothetical protein